MNASRLSTTAVDSYFRNDKHLRSYARGKFRNACKVYVIVVRFRPKLESVNKIVVQLTIIEVESMFNRCSWCCRKTC